MYRNIRYTLDRTHPLQPLAVVRAQNQGEFGCCLLLLHTQPVVEAVGMW